MNGNPFLDFIGIERKPSSHSEKIISGVGGFLAIFMIIQISYMALGDDAYLIVASMGAATVLLFAVPHGPLSQPWALFGGNLLSAFVGVACAQLIPDVISAAAAAVGISITVMYYLKCVHPPGGATALSAVVGGDAVHELGFMFVLTPVLLNVLVIFFVALLFNYFFKWRRYPVALASVEQATAPESVKSDRLSRQGIEHALRKIDSFIDVTDEDLKRIYRLAAEFDGMPEGKQSITSKRRLRT